MKTSQGLRKVKIQRRYLKYPESSCLIEVGDTKVVCTASVESRVPPFLRGKGSGWITAEYDMLPGSCPQRVIREARRGRSSGRTQEIQRLIGRSLRAAVDLRALGERTILIDCDVLQADGGTRTAAITGGFIVLVDALQHLKEEGQIEKLPLKDFIAAISAGIVDGKSLLDLTYKEDSRAEVDMNVVMTEKGKFIEIQGTAERKPFSRNDINKLLALAEKGIKELIGLQKEALAK